MIAPPKIPVLITCAGCQKQTSVKPTAKGSARLPTGWKRLDDATVYCRDCWTKRYYLRAVTMSVAEPLDATWPELRDALKSMWRATTRCSNWMMTQFYTRDVQRDDTMAKLPPMPQLYLYPEARALFPALPSQTVAALEQAHRQKYRAIRYNVLWTCSAALPTFRYPVPFPVHNQSWSAERDSNGERPAVSVRIGDRRFLLRLKGGNQVRRQIAAHDLIASGKAIAGELAIHQKGVGALRVKMVAWLPRTGDAKERHSTLTVKTGTDSLLAAVNAKDEKIWRYNGDHLRRWQAEHSRQLERWSEDAKYENRPVPNFAVRRRDAVRKFRHRMDSATHEIAAQLAGYAERRHYEAVSYDDREKSYCEQFPWFELRRKLAEKLDEKGIRLEFASGEAAEENREPLADDSKD
jgi:hypothetical protein